MNLDTGVPWRIEAMGDCSLIVEFGRCISPEINQTARAFAAYVLAHPIAGVTDVVPAFTTVALHYRPVAVIDGLPGVTDELPFQRLRRRVEAMLAQDIAREPRAARVIEVPVCYGGEFGPDLAEVAAACNLTPEAVIELHRASPHVVYMLGFAPGFPYIGGLDQRLAMPRRSTPRERVPAGTVAIARDQTAIYSLETPGGWNMIGRTPLKLFNPLADPPCLLQAGDELRFVPISPQQYQTIQEQQA
jgi:inhibitor of KinA